jgi:Protein of unknown function (DUF3035)
MRLLPLVSLVLLIACSDESKTRNFSLLRDAAPDTMAATQTPLSVPPALAIRPSHPGALASAQDTTPPTVQPPGSAGQEALLQAAGPTPPLDIRATVNANSGLVYPGPGFVDRLMNWTPPPDYAPVIIQAKGGWLSRIF